jgi:intein/homing endonuclease
MAKTLYDVTGGALRLNFHPGQLRAWDSSARNIFVLAGTQGGKCLAALAKIFTGTGASVEVCKIRPGDHILSLGKGLRIQRSKVLQSQSMGVKPLLAIVTATGRKIEVTKEHPLYSETGWKPAGEMLVGDWIGVPRSYPELGQNTADPQEMRLLGYILGDGCTRGITPQFTNTDVTILKDFNDCLPQACTLVQQSEKRPDYRIRRSKDAPRGNALRELCVQWGIWDTLAIHKRIPEFVFTLRNEFIAEVLQGLYSTDGTVDVKSVVLGLSSEGMLDDVQHLLLRFGIITYKWYRAVGYDERGNIFDSWRLRITDRESLFKFAENIGFVGDKQAKLLELLERKLNHRENVKDVCVDFPLDKCWRALGHPQYRPETKHNGYVDQEGRELLHGFAPRGRKGKGYIRQYPSRDVAQQLAEHFGVGINEAYSDIYWDKITEILDTGMQETWDLEIEGTRNFVAQDIFAHNTSFVPWWLWREIYGAGSFKGKGGGDYLAVSASFDMFKLKLLPEMRTVFEEVLNLGRYWSGDKVIELRNPKTGKFQAKRADDTMWGRIILRSAQSGSGLESASAMAAVLDEVGHDDYRVGTWQAVRRRLSLSRGRVLGATTLYNVGWLKFEVYDKWKNGDTNYDVIQFDSAENPAFSQEEFEEAKKDLQPWLFSMFYKGEYARPAGLIYGDVTEKHIVKPFKIPFNWPCYVGIDIGPLHTALIFVAVDPEGSKPSERKYYVFKEEMRGGLTTDEQTDLAIKDAEGYKVVAWFGGAPSEHQFRWDWGAKHIPVLAPPISDVESGITRVVAAARTGRFFVFDSLHSLRDELGTYSRQSDARGLPTSEIKDKSKFHMLDALRYCMVGATTTGAAGAMF